MKNAFNYIQRKQLKKILFDGENLDYLGLVVKKRKNLRGLDLKFGEGKRKTFAQSDCQSV